jgi:hypothetical protein
MAWKPGNWGTYVGRKLYKSGRKSARSGLGRRGAPPLFRGSSLSFTYSFKGLVLYKPILNYELHTQSGMVGRRLHTLGTRIVASAKRQVGVKTGKLQRSIHMAHYSSGRKQHIRIGSNMPYALLHHQGTKPHVILPKPPRTTLVFTKGARIIHSSVVMHPGTKANRYLTDPMRRHIRK